MSRRVAAGDARRADRPDDDAPSEPNAAPDGPDADPGGAEPIDEPAPDVVPADPVSPKAVERSDAPGVVAAEPVSVVPFLPRGVE